VVPHRMQHRDRIPLPPIVICVCCLGAILAARGYTARGETTSAYAAPSVSRHYVWCGAAGAANGTDWTNAYVDLPVSLIRGHTYYVAGSTSCSYRPHAFNDPVSGTEVITMEKATAANSGNVPGWQASFGTAQARWLSINAAHQSTWYVVQDYYIFEGVYGTPGRAGTYGFLLKAPPSVSQKGLSIFFATRSGGRGSVLTNIKIDHLELDNSPVDTNTSDQIACCGTMAFDSNGEIYKNFTFENSFVHDINGGMLGLGGSNILIDHMWFARWRATLTQHNEAITLKGDNQNITIRNSVFQDGSGTGGIVLISTNSMNGFYIYNNVFFTSSPTVMDYVPGNDGTGLPAWNYAQGAPLANNHEFGSYSNFFVFNNTIYSTSGFSGIQIFPAGKTPSTWSNLNIFNNLWFNSQVVGIQTTAADRSWNGEKEGNNVVVNSKISWSPGFTCGVHHDVCITSYQNSPVPISSISISSAGIVRVDTTAPHGLSLGDPVLVIDSELNGRACGADTTYPYPSVTAVPSSTKFQYKLAGVPAVSNCATGGSAILIRHPSPMPFVSPPDFNFQISSSTVLGGNLNNGINLTSTCTSLGLDCADPSGNRRPANGAWTVGAYQLPTQ
jgi:hypothetical protein